MPPQAPLLGLYVGGLWPLLEPLRAILAALGTYFGGLGLTNVQTMAKSNMSLFLKRGRDLWPRGEVLGRSWGQCWRSWAALWTYVGGLGPLWRPKLAVLYCFRGRSPPAPWGHDGVRGIPLHLSDDDMMI